LKRTDLAFHLANEVADAQEILLSRFEFAQRLAFLRFELGDACGFFENHPAILGFTGKNLRDVPLSHDAVAGPPNPRAHEKLLDVLEAARRPVDEVFAAPVAEHAPRNRDFVVGQLNSGGRQVLRIHVTDIQRHFCHAERLAPVSAAKDDIRHFASTQSFG